MGVPLLLTWLKRRFASCFLPSTNTPATDCLYIDVNGLVYQSAALATTGDSSSSSDIDFAILRRLFDLLDDIIFRLVHPKLLVYLAVDGISPMGKLAQQRSRRRRRRNNNNNNNNNREWDSNSITVGTPFMSRLTDALHFYCASRAERINGERLREQQRRFTNNSNQEKEKEEISIISTISFVVDDVWRPGEGENKIVDAIRRFRSEPNYNPNTSHVICSSDTDVTVCSLILHEPRIHVLRYEYPLSGNNMGGRNNNNNKSWRSQAGDSWSSTFFSIHSFREELKSRLRLQTNEITSIEEIEKSNRQFERALHDVVFVLLLFGNDFLPSVGCRIEEGFLDDLLELLASDFISRGRTIVDPATNTIQFDAARYALDSLSEMRDLREGGGGGGLCIENGSEGASDWGFMDDSFMKKQQILKEEEEAKLAPQCYAYWTMLQWSLHNSAGFVEHWGCYYPFSTAPPLHLLRKYCGVLSYDALMELAETRSQHHNNNNNNVTVVRNAGPTDVLVQLLVLLPARSISLFPSAIRNAYSEIELLVNAPVERLEFKNIEAWCAKKRELFTEEERTRFQAYALASQPHVIIKGINNDIISGNEMIFVADWDSEKFNEEVQHVKNMKKMEMEKKYIENNNNNPLPSVSNTKGIIASSFFNSRPARKGSAAAAALLAASQRNENISNPKESTNSTSDNNNNNNNNNNNPVNVVIPEILPPPEKNVEVIRCGGFTLITAPINVLEETGIFKGVGAITGDTFICGKYTTTPLSRHSQTMRVRLRWRIASKPLLGSSKFIPDLLPGYKTPESELKSLNTLSDEKEKVGVKRAALSSEVNSSDDDENNNNNNESSSSTHDFMVDLQKKREAVRQRLEVLQTHSADTTTD